MERYNDNVENTTGNDQQMVVVPKKVFYKKRWFIILLAVSCVLLALVVFAVFFGFQTYKSGLKVVEAGRGIAEAVEVRDLNAAKSKIQETQTELAKTEEIFHKSSFYSYIPLIGGYWHDVDHGLNAGRAGLETASLTVTSLEPYADVLGFTGSGTIPEFASAEERIIFLASTVEKIAPDMDKIVAKLNEVSSEIGQINENRYPKKIGDTEIRSKIVSMKTTITSSTVALAQFQPMVKLLPDLLGNPDPRKYLLLFQNNAELRPTGGFMTAYATMIVTKGKIEGGISEDIYTLDAGFKKKVPAPEPIQKYLPLVYTWNLRDMNLSPDFKISMDTFTKYARESSAYPESDAIIAIDTEVPVRLLKVLGPIGVPGYGGKFSAENDPRCNCPQVIYELENIITRPTYEIREGRKSILGPLMNSMLANMMNSPKAKWAEFFNIFTESIREKHLMMYFFDTNKQNAVEVLGAAGRINDYKGDYLHINDTNFAGAKSNLFVESEVDQNIQIDKDGKIIKKITLTYRNPAKGSNCNLEAGQLCLNGLLRDWIRVYVPKGSVLKASKGSEVDVIVSEDLGKTVFEGFYTLSPESVKKLEFEYEVPSIEGNEYRLLIQKQGGTDTIKHTITLNGKKSVVYQVNSDQEIVLPK